MSAALGVDLGTTFTTAALHDGTTINMIDLASRNRTMPSAIYLSQDDTFLVGEPALRRAATDPGRSARQFKRRFGDTTPLLLGGTPMSADLLTGELLKAVLAIVTERHGSVPERIAVTHPANWGGYKLELLDQSVRHAGLADVLFITEPEAAVLHYADQKLVKTDAPIAVFDLGGGTFDAAVVRKTETGTEFLGRPEGIERLGGIDFDESLYSFVNESLDGVLEDLDIDDPHTRTALERLRNECVLAKEALSSDEVADIPVSLPTLQTSVRITRGEFEGLIRPNVTQAIEALRRALRSAEVDPDDLHAVLLAGGSSRIPLMAEMLTNELGRPIAVDAHPKFGVAMGAALAAHRSSGDVAATSTPTPLSESAAAAEPTTSTAPITESTAAVTEAIPAVTTPAPAPAPASGPPPAPAPSATPTTTSSPSKPTVPMIVAAIVAVLAIGGGAFALSSSGGDAGPPKPIGVDPALTTSDG